MSLLPALGSLSQFDINTPLDYDANLFAFWAAETGLTLNGSQVTQWDDQGPNGLDLTVPVNKTGPTLVDPSQNGLPGLDFDEVPISLSLELTLSSASSTFDNFFFGAGTKTIGFAGRMDQLTDSRFNTTSVIAQKGAFESDGWILDITPDGTIRFRQFMTNGSFWKIEANGFFAGVSSSPKVVLGTLRYSGGNTSGSGTLTLFNPSSGDFIQVGTITTASSSSKQNDSGRRFSIGNIDVIGNQNANRPFKGPLFAVWMTKPEATAFDQRYQRRWA